MTHDETIELKRLKLWIGMKLVDIEQHLCDIGLESMTHITFVARDPTNPDMFIVLNNVDDLQEVAALLTSH
uniref:Uncharacterized protein n=1 Tax=viral metagenome TaxID=1070528 RepID=A0A6M3IN62_9ZZZZ